MPTCDTCASWSNKIKAGLPEDTLLCTLYEQTLIVMKCYISPCLDTSKESLVNTRSNHSIGFCKLHQRTCTMRYCRCCSIYLCVDCFLEEKHSSHKIYDFELIMDKVKLYCKTSKSNIIIGVSQKSVKIKLRGKLEPNKQNHRRNVLAMCKLRTYERVYLELPLPNSIRMDNVVKVTRNTPKKMLFSFGGEGNEDGMLHCPWGLACNQVGHFIVADSGNHRIQIFDKSGKYVNQFGKKGTLPGEFDYPTSVAVDPLDRIIVVDSKNHRVQVFDSSGKFIFMFGECGKDPDKFYRPWAVACSTYGQILVSDSHSQRIRLFDHDGNCIDENDLEDVGFTLPSGICFGPNHQIITTDFRRKQLVIRRNDFDYRCELSLIDVVNVNSLPLGIVCDDEDRIAVVDRKNHQIQVFQYDDFKDCTL